MAFSYKKEGASDGKTHGTLRHEINKNFDSLMRPCSPGMLHRSPKYSLSEMQDHVVFRKLWPIWEIPAIIFAFLIPFCPLARIGRFLATVACWGEYCSFLSQKLLPQRAPEICRFPRCSQIFLCLIF